ncbi:hypothetical protein SLEP1_g53189 [Rubroshorea leprosula]|uniref:Uncharacterized protein n=1 Tax=Rubroshorea leprosula TaxID=152421 RepID=A0AAV5MAG3_9ROSI|nr:hypothetical protein SLEP1_g53189 [Rubroshorea leprosula]
MELIPNSNYPHRNVIKKITLTINTMQWSQEPAACSSSKQLSSASQGILAYPPC